MSSYLFNLSVVANLTLGVTVMPTADSSAVDTVDNKQIAVQRSHVTSMPAVAFEIVLSRTVYYADTVINPMEA